VFHLAGLGLWLAAILVTQARLLRARRSGQPQVELLTRRVLRRWLALEHLALVAAFMAGVALLGLRGWGVGHARWLDAKLVLCAFLIVPLEGMHAWVSHVWIGRGLGQTPAPPFSKDLARGIGMDDMLRAIAAPLLALALPALVWLSVGKPF
jgi:hypothetical protein